VVATRATRTGARALRPADAALARLVMDLHPSDRGTQAPTAGDLFQRCPLLPGHPRRCFRSNRFRVKQARRDKLHDAAQPSFSATSSARRRLRRRRISPRRLPGGPGQAALPGTELPCTLLLPPRDPHPSFAPATCCVQKTITVPPSVNAKTAQRHDYPSAPTGAPMRGAARWSGPTPDQGPATTTLPALVPYHGLSDEPLPRRCTCRAQPAVADAFDEPKPKTPAALPQASRRGLADAAQGPSPSCRHHFGQRPGLINVPSGRQRPANAATYWHPANDVSQAGPDTTLCYNQTENA